MNKLRVTFRSCPREVFVSTLADLTVEFPVVSFSVNGALVDSNIDLTYTGQSADRRIFVKEYDLDLTKNFDNLSFTLSKRQVDYEQIPGLGYQSQTEDSFLSDAEFNHITTYSSRDFSCAEVLLLEYSEDSGNSWTEFRYTACYTYLVDGGLFNGKELASDYIGLPEPGDVRGVLTVPEMKTVAAQLQLPYTNDGMPVLDKNDLGFDTTLIINYDGATDVSAMVAEQDAVVSQTTCIIVYNPV